MSADTTREDHDMRMTEDELAAAADEFLPAEPFDDDGSDSDNDYEDDLSYESEF